MAYRILARRPGMAVLVRRPGVGAAARVLAAGLAALGSAGACVAAPAPSAAVATDDPSGHAALESVLVSSRSDRGAGDKEQATELAPISQVSEYEPELADPEPAPAPKAERPAAPGEAPGEESHRTAALPSDGEAVLHDVAQAYARQSKPRPSKFHGVVPGESSRADVERLWGEPAAAGPAGGPSADAAVLRYDLKPFRGVEALIEGDVARVIRVTLGDRATADELAQRLNLTRFEPVEVRDPASGDLLGVAYPEKGLTLLTDPATIAADAVVTHLVLQTLDARAFALRAESRPAHAYQAQENDLLAALEVDPNEAHAWWLLAGVRRLSGEAPAALEAAARAAELAPQSAAYALRHAQCLADAAGFDQAALAARKVLDDASAPALVHAEALALMGRLASLGDAPIAEKTIGFYTAAIEAADRLATGADPRERQAAKDLLVECHLAMAREVARRDFGLKSEVVGEWIGRASQIAEERIASDGGGLELRLGVARQALAALTAMKPTKDPIPWVEEAQGAADALLAAEKDPLFRARVQWELGEAYRDAVRVEHALGDADRALRLGTRAIERLSAGAGPRAESPTAQQTVGTLYFYLGAVNAVHKENHEEAVGWYEKARPILTENRPASEFVAPRREGEMLVSMGVSYWEQDRRDLAIELTEMGAALMQRSVACGVLEEPALAVPYGNLASMHQQQGDSADAARYGAMARAARGESGAEPARGAIASPPVAGRNARPQGERVATAAAGPKRGPSAGPQARVAAGRTTRK